MHKTQMDYAAARAAYEAASAACADEKAKVLTGDPASDAYIDAAVLIEEKWCISEHYDTLYKAEDAMIEWAHNRALALPEAAPHRETLEQVYAARWRISIRKRLVDLAFRLDAK